MMIPGTNRIKVTVKQLIPDMERAKEFEFDSGSQLDVWLGRAIGYTTAQIRSNGGHLTASDGKRHFIVVKKGGKEVIKPEEYEYYINNYLKPKEHDSIYNNWKRAKEIEPEHKTDRSEVKKFLNLINRKYSDVRGRLNNPVVYNSAEFTELQHAYGVNLKD